jgi:TonB family protein
MPKTLRLLLPLALAALSTSARAEWRCDCTTIVASCDAQVAVKRNWVDITTDQKACARVDYFIDGLPFVALAVDGSARADWISPTENPSVMVQSCQVCADKLTGQPTPAGRAAGEPGAADGAAQPAPLIQTAPEYPAGARARGLEGYVVVGFKVSPQGYVEDPTVIDAQPARIFDQAALAAIRRWRYPEAGAGEEERSLQERLDFRISDPVSTQPEGTTRQATAASRPQKTNPRNECVRESIAYNFGEVVEVGLINACPEPVVLFSCALGTGGELGRWRCAADDPRAIVLVRPGDPRAGLPGSAQDRVAASTYADNHFLMRPPNTEYWWIACGEDDRQCQQAARDWSAQLNGRSATIDPAQVTRIRVARSY